MNDNEKMLRLLRGHVPLLCDTCKKALDYIGSGRYECPLCGKIILDDFGKIKEYLSVHGPTPAWKLARELGIRREIIDQYVKDGSVGMIHSSNLSNLP